MREAEIEKYLTDRVRSAGGRAYKFVSPGNAGVPDRLVIMPGGKIYFVEMKNEAGRMSKLQRYQFKKFKDLGCNVRVVDSKELVDLFIREVSGCQ